MKTFLALTLLLFFSTAKSQTSFYELDFNNTKALITNSGYFFEDSFNAVPLYEVPKGSDKKAIYSMSLWMMGKDDGGLTYGSVGKYGNEIDLFPGPIADDYSGTEYDSLYGVSLWEITSADIDNHIANYTTVGYVAPASITSWPANGNTANGIAQQLAPFEDLNDNTIYEPLLGEYPLIQGDKAVYVIMNDENGTHQSGSAAIGAEVHVMFYHYATTDHLNNATFINVKLYNRRAKDLSTFYVGLFTDFDLGNYADDFMGCDSTRNMLYVYNADNFDQDNMGLSGYGENPPAVGIVSLSENIGSGLVFTPGIGATGAPNGAYESFNCLSGKFRNGLPVMNDGLAGTSTAGYETKFHYSGNPNGSGWSEVSAGHIGDDRRGLLSSLPSQFNSGDMLCYTYAVIYSDADTTSFVQAQELGTVADFVQGFYDSQTAICPTSTVSINEPKSTSELSIYPNPTSGLVTIIFPDLSNSEAENVLIRNTMGQIVLQESVSDKTNLTLDISPLPTGVYFISVSNNTTYKIIKQ